MKYMMASAEAASPMPPHARIPSYITAFQSSPVRIWWQEKAATLCHDKTTRGMGSRRYVYNQLFFAMYQCVSNWKKNTKIF
jgi:hypothetical protein